MGWNDDKPWPKSAADLEQTNKDIEQYPIIHTPKPFGEVMKEFNEEAEKEIKQVTGIDNLPKPWKEGNEITLEIPEGWSAKTVQAIQIGDLAVVTTEDEERCIAHVPTQTWFDNAIPDCQAEEGYTIKQLCLWAWKVQQNKQDVWAILNKYTNQNYKIIPPNVLTEIKCYCLSVPVV